MATYQRETIALPVKLTPLEHKERALQLAEAIKEHDDLEREKKANAKRFKELMDEQNVEIRRLARIVDKGEEPRQVGVEWVPNVQERVMEMVRLDLGEFVRNRPMSPEELRQHANKDLFKDNPQRPVTPKEGH